MTPRHTPKKPAKPKAKIGRPSAYKPEFDHMAAKACALGATDHDLAELFSVSDATIDNWKAAHSSFLGSIRDAKDSLDTKVERSLFERATGYSHPAVKILTVSGGMGSGSSVEEVPYTEHYPPDATSMIFWLKNRQPAKWRDKQEVEHTGKDGGPVQVWQVGDKEIRF